MFYDARISIGMMFTLIGTILATFGLATRGQPGMYAKSAGIDANLWWGLVLLAFGVAVMFMGRRAQMRMEKSREKGVANRE